MAKYLELKPFGPVYPALSASVAKYRRVKDPSPEQAKAHGEAVLSAIRALQRSELARVTPSHAAPCASGTWESDGNAICKAIRSQHSAQLQRDAKADRARRSDDQIREQYEAAMSEKRARIAAEASGGDSEPNADNVASDCDSAADGALEAVSELDMGFSHKSDAVVSDLCNTNSVESHGSADLIHNVPTCVVVFTSHAGRRAFDRSGLATYGEPAGYRHGAATIALADADQVARLRGNRLIGLPRKKRTPSVKASEAHLSPSESETVSAVPTPSQAKSEDASPSDKPRVRVKAGSRPSLGTTPICLESIAICPLNSSVGHHPSEAELSKPRYRVKAGSRPHVPDPSSTFNRKDLACPSTSCTNAAPNAFTVPTRSSATVAALRSSATLTNAIRISSVIAPRWLVRKLPVVAIGTVEVAVRSDASQLVSTRFGSPMKRAPRFKGMSDPSSRST